MMHGTMNIKKKSTYRVNLHRRLLDKILYVAHNKGVHQSPWLALIINR